MPLLTILTIFKMSLFNSSTLAFLSIELSLNSLFSFKALFNFRLKSALSFKAFSLLALLYAKSDFNLAILSFKSSPFTKAEFNLASNLSITLLLF